MHSRRLRHFAIASAAVLASVLSPLPTGVASADDCPDIEVVFARGTNDAPGLGNVGGAFVDSLRSKVGGRSVGAYAVNYPASFDFLAAADGANDMSSHIQFMVDNCPNTRLVLGGYSQGAAVMDVVTTSPVAGLGYTAPLPAAAVPHVAAVAVFGNPSARFGRPLTILSPDFGARTADLCNTNDPVCSRGDDFDAHVRYPQSGLVKLAAQWITKNVQQRYT